MKVTGVILAGGASKRMGTDKAFAPFRSQEMIRYAIEVLRPICDEILISGNFGKLQCLGLTVVEDVYGQCGPLGGLHASLHQAKHPSVLVLPCDVPLVTTAVCEHLLALLQGCDAVVPIHPDGKTEPLVACYQKHLSPLIEEQILLGNLKMHNFLDKINVRHVPVANTQIFKNVNFREDLE